MNQTVFVEDWCKDINHSGIDFSHRETEQRRSMIQEKVSQSCAGVQLGVSYLICGVGQNTKPKWVPAGSNDGKSNNKAADKDSST
jgi:hypothetical protein